jgi:hypothetical protein
LEVACTPAHTVPQLIYLCPPQIPETSNTRLRSGH